jgi:hypothetical protein
LTLTNASVVTFKSVSSTVYVWTVKASTSSHGTAKASIGANTATDSIGNGNTASNEISWTYDNVAPTTTASGRPSSWTGGNVTVSLSTNTNTSTVGCNNTHTTYYCVDTANTCTPNTT